MVLVGTVVVLVGAGVTVALAVIADIVGAAVIVAEEGAFIVCAKIAPSVFEEANEDEPVVNMADPDTERDVVAYVVKGAVTLSAAMPSLASVLEGADGGQSYTV